MLNISLNVRVFVVVILLSLALCLDMDEVSCSMGDFTSYIFGSAVDKNL